jgi:hypothetical protein
VTPGRALPVSVTHPDKIVATVDGERIRPAGDRLSIDKSTLPRVSDNLQANLKVRSDLVSGSGIVERIDQDTIRLRSGDHFTVPKQSIVYRPKHGGEPLRIFGADALEPGMAISYSIRDGQPGRIVLMGIVVESPLWRQFGVTPAPVSPLTAKVLEWIGLHLSPIAKERFRGKNVLAKYSGGLDVTFVRTDNGAADKAGFHEVDIVVGLQGRPMVSLQDLDSAMQDAVEQIKAGDAESLQFDVLHSGETVRRNVPFPAGKLDLRTVEPDNESSPATQAAESPSETTAVPRR